MPLPDKGAIVTSISLGQPTQYLTGFRNGVSQWSRSADKAKVFPGIALAYAAQAKVIKAGDAPHKDYIQVHNLEYFF